MEKYHPEAYWSRVAEEVAKRETGALLAGDNEPYYDYKRKKFLKLLKSISFEGKSVLEVGCGPGGNLLELLGEHPKSITGVDISSKMISLAEEHLKGRSVRLLKTEGTKLPLEDTELDIVFSSTVLQHNSDER